jgi:hypothetical protein
MKPVIAWETITGIVGEKEGTSSAVSCGVLERLTPNNTALTKRDSTFSSKKSAQLFYC